MGLPVNVRKLLIRYIIKQIAQIKTKLACQEKKNSLEKSNYKGLIFSKIKKIKINQEKYFSDKINSIAAFRFF